MFRKSVKLIAARNSRLFYFFNILSEMDGDYSNERKLNLTRLGIIPAKLIPPFYRRFEPTPFCFVSLMLKQIFYKFASARGLDHLTFGGQSKIYEFN